MIADDNKVTRLPLSAAVEKDHLCFRFQALDEAQDPKIDVFSWH